ncbi:MAG: hypothetical protein ACOCU5_00575 [Bacillota bacterium]
MITFCALMLTMKLGTLQGEESVPANRNLFNPGLFEMELEQDAFTHGSLTSTRPIPIDDQGDYTFSFPEGVGSDVDVKVYGEDEDDPYVDETLSDAGGVCDDRSFSAWECTFESTAKDLTIELNGGNAFAMHLYYLGTDGFQLEAGDARTDYIPYEPLTDSAPEILGRDDLYVSYASDAPIMTILEENIEVHDEIDGAIPTAAIDIVHDEYTGNETTVGEYTVTLEASDTSGNTSSFDLDIHVYDLVDPVISGPKTLEVDVDDALTLEAVIAEHFTFTDAHDETIETYAIVDDDYSDAIGTLGEKNVTLRITDASGNEATHTFAITTIDDVAPTIEGDETLTVHQSDMPDLEAILSGYAAEDNHTPDEAIELTIGSSTYQPDASSGQYTLDIIAEDASGNETVMNVAVDVIDDIAPTLLGSSHERVSYTETFDLEAYIAGMTCTDNDDTTLSKTSIATTRDDYVDGVPGRYTYEFRLEDASGNEARHTLVVEVLDDVAPVFNTVTSVIVEKDAPLSEDDIQSMMMEDDAIKTFAPTSHEVLNDDYTDHSEEEGTYHYTVEYSNADGETMTRSIELQVVDIEKDSSLNVASLVGALTVLSLAGIAFFITSRR